MRFVRPFIVILGCLYLCGGHYGIMQVIAWSTMLVDYSQQDGFAEGARRTFNGENPCSRCLAIEDSKKRESDEGRDPQAPAAAKNQLLPDYVASLLTRLRTPVPTDAPQASFHEPAAATLNHHERPPVPPPRTLA